MRCNAYGAERAKPMRGEHHNEEEVKPAMKIDRPLVSVLGLWRVNMSSFPPEHMHLRFECIDFSLLQLHEFEQLSSLQIRLIIQRGGISNMNILRSLIELILQIVLR